MRLDQYAGRVERFHEALIAFANLDYCMYAAHTPRHTRCPPYQEEDRTMSNESDRTAIYEHRDAYNSTLKAGDLEGWLSTLSDDCVFLAPGEPALNGKEAVRQWARNILFNVFDIELDYDFEELEFVGSSAQAWGWFQQKLTPKDGSEALEIRGKFLDVFKTNPDGEWKLAWCAYSPDHE